MVLRVHGMDEVGVRFSLGPQVKVSYFNFLAILSV